MRCVIDKFDCRVHSEGLFAYIDKAVHIYHINCEFKKPNSIHLILVICRISYEIDEIDQI